MNRNLTRTLKFIALVIPLLFIFVFAQECVFENRNYDTVRIERFYDQEENSLDVVFIGASEVSNDFIPGYAFEKYGFTSYMYAMDSNQGSLYLSQLKEIQKHQNPGIIFVDLYGFLRADDSPLFDETRLRLYTASIPFSTNKFQTIMEFPCENKLSYFFPLIMYHGDSSIGYAWLIDTYDQLTKQEKPSSLKGAQTRTTVYTGTGDPGEAFDPATYVLTDHSKAYLVEFLNYCKDNELNNIVFTNFPRYLENEDNHSLLHLVDQTKAIVKQYGYPVWDLQEEIDTIGIVRNQDFYNEHHLNIYGQLKLTDYLGVRITGEHGLIPRVQSERSKLEWEECAFNSQEFIEIAKESILSGEDKVYCETISYWLYR